MLSRHLDWDVGSPEGSGGRGEVSRVPKFRPLTVEPTFVAVTGTVLVGPTLFGSSHLLAKEVEVSKEGGDGSVEGSVRGDVGGPRSDGV